MPCPLVVVDVQVGFINNFTHHIPDRIVRLVERGEHGPLLFTKFVNVPGSPYRRFLAWDECSGPPETDLVPTIQTLANKGRVFEKRGFTGLPQDLSDHLGELAPDEVAVVGIDTDMCVLKVALDIFDRGIKPVVLTDCCASTMGAPAHLAGLAILSRNVGPEQLRDTGLGQGTIAAPPTSAKRA